MKPLKMEDQSGDTITEHLDCVKQDHPEALIAIPGGGLSPQELRRVKRRVDLRVTSVLGLIYAVAHIDRINMPFAQIAGLEADMDLSSTRYSIVVLVFFIPYIIFQPAATLLMRKMGPRAFLFTITLFWGISQLAFGFVRSWYQLVPLRLLLGLFEAGAFPASIYLISCWFRRYELQKRVAFFYVIGTIASAFTGALAYGFSQMEGLGHVDGWEPSSDQPRGIAGWRWIFIMMGLLTIFVAFVCFFLVVDFPDVPSSARALFTFPFVNERERLYLLSRIEEDRQDTVPTEFNLREFARGARDIKISAFAFIFCLTTMTNYSVAYFMPIILNAGMGFSRMESSFLSCPPYIFACILMTICGWLSDKYRIRSPIIISNSLICIIGLCLTGFCEGPAVRYFGLFLVTGAGSTNVSAVVTWQANNVRGQWKRALSSATLIAAGGVGGIIGGLVFRTQDAPTYYPGVYACLAGNGLSVILSVVLVFKFVRANRRSDAVGSEHIIEDLEGFRYTI